MLSLLLNTTLSSKTFASGDVISNTEAFILPVFTAFWITTLWILIIVFDEDTSNIEYWPPASITSELLSLWIPLIFNVPDADTPVSPIKVYVWAASVALPVKLKFLVFVASFANTALFNAANVS